MTTQTHPGAVKTALVNLRRRRTYLIDPDTQFDRPCAGVKQIDHERVVKSLAWLRQRDAARCG